MSRRIIHDHNHDGIDRRGFLECMAWAGTGAVCVLSGGVLKSYALSDVLQLVETSRRRSQLRSRSATVISASIKPRILTSPPHFAEAIARVDRAGHTSVVRDSHRRSDATIEA